MNYRTAIPILIMPLAALAPLASAPEAHAIITSVTCSYTTLQDSAYVSDVYAQGGLYNTSGPAGEAQTGRSIACDIEGGTRTALQERNYVFHINRGDISLSGATILVNTATEDYLGFGPTIT
jgi:hypothetical protein